MLRKYPIFGVQISTDNYKQVVTKVIKAAILKQRLTIAPVASHPLVLASKKSEFKQILNSFNLVLPDSQYVKWALNYLYNLTIKKRVYGPELFLEICKQAEQNGLKIFLYGNNISRLKEKLNTRFPKLKIMDIDLEHKIINNKDLIILNKALKTSMASIMFIGLGSPLQHEITYQLKNAHLPIIMIGAAFDFVSESQKQAPTWMQNSGLEWLSRLYQEPGRLWKRYLLLGPIFIHSVFLQKVSQNKKR